MLTTTITSQQKVQLFEALKYRWDINARHKQKLPDGDWFIWVVCAGRGFGKTRTGGETVRTWVKDNAYVNMIGATADDARDIMIEGESGILAICPRLERPLYKKSDRRLDWPNGAKSLIFTADEPERLRGKQHMKIWMDEVGAWRYQESFDQAMMGLRLGSKPQGIVTTTPKATPLVRTLLSDKRNHITTGSTYENRANLSPGFFDYVIKRYEGTRLGRQELNAELLDDTEGALWKRKTIDDYRIVELPEDFEYISIGVDPSATSTGDEAGIVAVGRKDGHYYVLADKSLQASPLVWAKTAVDLYNSLKANQIYAESNNGGEMVAQTILTVDPQASVQLVHASRGKQTRAEPVAALYEQGRGHHAGSFPMLEDEMCTWVPGEDSPNHMDALVWAFYGAMGGGVTAIKNPFYDYEVESEGRINLWD